MENSTLHVVHCVDSEGPLNETIEATFMRLESIFGIRIDPSPENLRRLQNMELDLGESREAIARCFAPELLRYNASWSEINIMLDEILSEQFRMKFPDDFGEGWVYSWHCLDHVGYDENPRYKDLGYGKIFQFYKNKLKETKSTRDELNWHFHPLSINGNPLSAATSYVNNYEHLIQILCRRVLEDKWFPVVNRPGFHSERPDSHVFLEQWMPFDYANQTCNDIANQPDLLNGRFGDWSRASSSWCGYHPSHDDYQQSGECRRVIFRCLNVGTRLRSLTIEHVREAFLEARTSGSAILAFADHDYRDIRIDIGAVRKMLRMVKSEYPDVAMKFSGAAEAAIAHLGLKEQVKLKLGVELVGNTLVVKVLEGEVFGPQPFLAMKTKSGKFLHDNFDVIEHRKAWSYVFDDQTFSLSEIEKLGVGSAGATGNGFVSILEVG